MPTVELLSPAGNMTCMRAAVENGADAVYFGVEDFNARARADNFARADLPSIMKYLHDRGAKGYLVLNVLIFSDEVAQAAELLVAASEAGVDAVLVQDLGIAHLASQLVPELPIHASTQMTISSPRAMKLLESWGLKRFVLPREFSIAETAKLHASAESEIEVFVHGALCVAYSGQCLTSEALGGRSANRGQCAQACRQPYDMMVDGEKIDLEGRRYLLSPQDLAGIERIPQLIEAGVVCLKIEGRLKTPEYVANITRHYRQALDKALAGRRVKLSKTAWQEMAQSFSRGLSTGFLDGVDHQKLVTADFPKSRGLPAGRVAAVNAPWITLEGLDVPLKAGDGVVFDNGNPERDEPGGPIYEIRMHKGTTEIALAHQFPYGAIEEGNRVWKTGDPALNQRLRASFESEARTLPLTLRVEGKGDAPLLLTGTVGRDSVTVESGEKLATSTGAGLDKVLLAEKLGRFGGTRYHLASFEIDLAPGLMLPVSALNRLRRSLVEKMEALRAMPAMRVVHREALADARREPVSAATLEKTELSVFCRSEEQIRAACDQRVDRIYADFEDPRGFKESVAVARAANIPIYLATPRIEKPGEEGFFRKLAGYNPDGVLIRNLGGLLYFKEQHPGLKLVGDFSLNCANDLTARRLVDLGLDFIVPSYDLNFEQLESLLQRFPGGRMEIVLHQYMPMFHMEHCVFAAFLSEGKDYTDCGRPCESHDVALRDHLGNLLPVKADVGCRNTVFNGQAQSGALYLDRFLQLGVRRFRLELLTEDGARAHELIRLYRSLLQRDKSAKAVWSSLRATQRLGVTRGTLDR